MKTKKPQGLEMITIAPNIVVVPKDNSILASSNQTKTNIKQGKVYKDTQTKLNMPYLVQGITLV